MPVLTTVEISKTIEDLKKALNEAVANELIELGKSFKPGVFDLGDLGDAADYINIEGYLGEASQLRWSIRIKFDEDECGWRATAKRNSKPSDQSALKTTTVFVFSRVSAKDAFTKLDKEL